MALSAQDFIRALRAPADPPHPDGPAKIQIATDVWHSRSLYIPNKDEAIVDWLLARLLKDKDRQPGDANPILDERYWTLLRDVLVDPATAKLRPVRAWLVPILQRTPLAPIAIAVFASWVKHASTVTPAQASASAECLAALWPLAVAKLSAETLLDCFAAVIHYFIGPPKIEQAFESDVQTRLRSLCQQIVGSYRYALANASNKKKLFSVFTQQHLQAWTRCVGVEQGDLAPVFADVYEAGVETMFYVEVLRQAQDRDDAFYFDPLTKVMTSDPTFMCSCLPRLFGAYIQATRKHRAVLFGQSSHQAAGASADQARLASLRFLAMCDSISGQASDADVRWRTRAQLFQIMDSEGLYGANNEQVLEVLRLSGDEAIVLLADAIRDGQQKLVEVALEVLATITHIDYDLLSHSIPRVLPLLLAVPSSTTPAYTYLQHLLDYHSKTRTMDSLVETILKACIPQTLSGVETPPTSASSSPVFQRTFADDLAKSLTSFLTPGQLSGSVDCVLRYLRDHLEALETSTSQGEESGRPHRKKRKVDSSVPSATANGSSRAAVAFSLMSRIASIVLSSLPTRYLLEDTRLHVTEALQEFYVATRSTLKDILKQIKRGPEGTTQYAQRIASIIIRLRYSIRTTTSIGISAEGDEKLSSKLLSALGSPVIPCLRAEILRTLLSDADLGYCELTPVFDEVLSLLEDRGMEDESTWSGNADDIQDNAQAMTATCHLVFSRWMSLIDASATPEQLAQLAALLASPSSSILSNNKEAITLYDILQRALHNAETWELHRFRDALLERINMVTKPLDSIDVETALKTVQSQHHSTEAMHSIAATYRLLLCIPTEYLARGIRNDLLRRALAADVLFTVSTTPDLVYSSLFFREFLRRILVFMGNVEHSVVGPYLVFLLQHSPAGPSPTFTSTTSELIKMHLIACIKSSLKGDGAVLQDIISHFTAFVANQSAVEGQHRQELAWLGLMHLIDALVAEAKHAELNQVVSDQLKALHIRLSSMLLSQITSLNSQDLPMGDIAVQTSLLNLWHRCLVLQQWLSSEERLPLFGKALVARLLAAMHVLDSSSYPLYTAAMSIVQEEHRSSLSNDNLDVVLASHLAFYKGCEQQGRTELDELLSKFMKGISTASFSYILDLLSEGLSAPGLSLPDVANLVHLHTLLLQNAPEGSSKITQSSWNHCLQLFSAKPELLEDGTTRREVLRFISRQFNDRPALVRQLDLSSLWSILGTSLESSSHHEASTDKAAFHEIISTISALIRLRRDLLTSTLPHLAYILRRLFLSLRHLRPQLGAKQSKIVTDTLPQWINTHQPLSSEESKALARLFTTMTTKTIVRGQASAPAGKVVSLARPFSKHAAYVLQAYIEALNDQLCVFPIDMRKELEPGLFALCDIMGEYNRDALMVASLDAGGKTVLKSIWREYEKQKYIGKG